MFTEADLQADPAVLIEKITGLISNDGFEDPPTLITGILDFVFAVSFLKNKEDGIPFKAELASALLIYSMQYQEHSLKTSLDLDADAYNTSLMNWKKWSSCQYISARLNNEGARCALKEAMESKLDSLDAIKIIGAPEDSLYADQFKFALEYFTETRKALFGEIIESNDPLVYTPSKV